VILVCDICWESSPEPEWYCTTCDPEGLPYHETCWKEEWHHRHERSTLHNRAVISDHERLVHINAPNRCATIEKEVFKADSVNCFVEFNAETRKFQFGPRATTLFQPSQDSPRKPSFVSFLGHAASGKSFLLRAFGGSGCLAPIPAAGAQGTKRTCTSSDIHLYPDRRTADSDSPILFLDCEGLECAELPCSYRAKDTHSAAGAEITMKTRQKYTQNAYPRLIYAFSTCIVFVTSDPLKEASKIREGLLQFAAASDMGGYQGFRPSLFVVYNRFRQASMAHFDWSIEASTRAFLEQGELRDLERCYEPIRAFYIPSLRRGESSILLSQIDQFQSLLYHDHESALHRRRQHHLVFSPDRLRAYLGKA
jgi:hypothetical protein